jgi:hypothetical protein
LSVPESGIGNEDLFRGIGKDKFIVEFHPTNLFVWKDITIEVWLLDIQEGKLFYSVLALKCPLFSDDGHIFSLLSPELDSFIFKSENFLLIAAPTLSFCF